MWCVAMCLAAIVAGSGCDRVFGLHQGSLRGGGDAGGDAPLDDVPTDALACFGHVAPVGLFQTCLDALPTTPFQPPSDRIVDTDSDASCLPAVADACVIVATTITIDVTVRAIGTRPLVLIATGDLEVGSNGVLDVASYGSASGNAAGNDGSDCDGAVGSTACGGAGGSFGGAGGNGGAAGGGKASPAMAIDHLRGGCRGGAGGSGPSSGSGGVGGESGGAIYAIAGTTIDIAGRILASGAGGHGGMKGGAGGGAGGSGGVIGLDAPTVTLDVTAHLDADGGGGGEGADLPTTGANGSDPSGSSSAPGGSGLTTGGNGGNGSFGSAFDGQAGVAGQLNTGAGGGGGGAGLIRISSANQDLLGTLSPPPE